MPLSFRLTHEEDALLLALREWLDQGALTCHEISMAGVAFIRAAIKICRDITPDATDAEFVALSGNHGIGRIVTADAGHFSVHRLPDAIVIERHWLC